MPAGHCHDRWKEAKLAVERIYVGVTEEESPRPFQKMLDLCLNSGEPLTFKLINTDLNDLIEQRSSVFQARTPQATNSHLRTA